jgi:hypothetical protein
MLRRFDRHGAPIEEYEAGSSAWIKTDDIDTYPQTLRVIANLFTMGSGGFRFKAYATRYQTSTLGYTRSAPTAGLPIAGAPLAIASDPWNTILDVTLPNLSPYPRFFVQELLPHRNLLVIGPDLDNTPVYSAGADDLTFFGVEREQAMKFTAPTAFSYVVQQRPTHIQ